MATDKNPWHSSGSDQLDCPAGMAVNQDMTPRRKSPQMPPPAPSMGLQSAPAMPLIEILPPASQRRV